MRRYGKQAFTLFELIVAVGITAVLTVVAFSLLQGMMDVWKIADRNVSLEIEAQFVLDQIERDLESAFFKDGTDVMFAATVLENKTNSGNWVENKTKRPTKNSFDPNLGRYGWAGTWLSFFSASPSLNAVSYQIIRTRTEDFDSDEPRYLLHRTVVRQDHTLSNGYNLTDVSSRYVGSDPTSPSRPEAVKEPRKENVFAYNVIDFGVRLFARDPSYDATTVPGLVPAGMKIIFPIVKDFDEDEVEWKTEYLEHLASTGKGDVNNVLYPNLVEVYIRLIDEAGAQALYDLEAGGGDPSEWYKIVDAHSKDFSRAVKIQTNSF